MKRLNSRHKYNKTVDWNKVNWAKVRWGKYMFPLDLSHGGATYSHTYCIDGVLPDRCPLMDTLPTMSADTFKEMFPSCVLSVIGYIGKDE